MNLSLEYKGNQYSEVLISDSSLPVMLKWIGLCAFRMDRLGEILGDVKIVLKQINFSHMSLLVTFLEKEPIKNIK